MNELCYMFLVYFCKYSSLLVFRASSRKQDKFSKCLLDLLGRATDRQLSICTICSDNKYLVNESLRVSILLLEQPQALLSAATFDLRLQSWTDRGQKFRR